MKRFAFSILIAMALACMPAWASFTLVQVTKSPAHPCGSSASCSMSVTSTGAGHLLVLMFFSSSTHNIKQTGMTGGGTWVHPGVDAAGACQQAGSGLTVDCAYVLSSTAGATTVSWNADSTIFHDIAVFYEFSFTGSSVAFDTSNTASLTGFSTNPTAPALTLTGSNDVILEGLQGSNNAMSTIDSGFSGVYDNTDAIIGAAYLVNTASGTPPTWGNGNNQYVLNAVAFKEVSGGATKTCTVTTAGAGPC
jgi:hypothetical protein